MVYLFDPTGVSGTTGNVTFTKTVDGIVLEGTVIGLTEGLHGFHVHQLGHIAPGCIGAGGHFNPHKVRVDFIWFEFLSKFVVMSIRLI